MYRRAQKYIKENGKRPRTALVIHGETVPFKKIEHRYPQHYEEIHLGTEINNMLVWGQTHAPDHPVIEKLRQLVSQHSKNSVRSAQNEGDPRED